MLVSGIIKTFTGYYLCTRHVLASCSTKMNVTWSLPSGTVMGGKTPQQSFQHNVMRSVIEMCVIAVWEYEGRATNPPGRGGCQERFPGGGCTWTGSGWIVVSQTREGEHALDWWSRLWISRDYHCMGFGEWSPPLSALKLNYTLQFWFKNMVTIALR